MNVADSRRLAESLEQYGLTAAEGPHAADVVVLYSCVVRQGAEDRVHGQLHALQAAEGRSGPTLKVVVAGCVSDIPDWRKRYPFVDLIAEPGQDLTVRDRLIDLLDLSERYRFDPDQAVRAAGHLRGRHDPPGLQPLVHLLHRAVDARRRAQPAAGGHRRRGAHAGRARHPRGGAAQPDRRALRPRPAAAGAAVRAAAAARTTRSPGLERIRFLTSYPGDFGRDLVDAVADLPRVCEDVNLPIQSGDDDVLRRMKRGYVVEHYRQLIGRLRERMPDIGLSTDIIVGFPGETDAEFDNTLRMLDEFRFDVVHVAMYSPRPGTVAATEMLDDVPREEKRRRLHEVESAAEAHRHARSTRAISAARSTCWSKAWPKAAGTAARAPTSWSTSPATQPLGGTLVDVEITATEPWFLAGRVSSEAAVGC